MRQVCQNVEKNPQPAVNWLRLGCPNKLSACRFYQQTHTAVHPFCLSTLSLFHSITLSLCHSVTQSLNVYCSAPLLHFHSVTLSLIHTFTHSLIISVTLSLNPSKYWSSPHLTSHSFTLSLIQSVTQSLNVLQFTPLLFTSIMCS